MYLNYCLFVSDSLLYVRTYVYIYVCIYVRTYLCMYVWSVDDVAYNYANILFHVHTGGAASICFREWGYGHRAAAIGGGP